MVLLTKFNMKTMTSKKLLVSFVAAIALAVLTIAGVSAQNETFVSIDDIEVNGVNVLNAAGEAVNQPVAVSAGEKIPVRVEFDALENARDVRVKAWISGGREFAGISKLLHVVDGGTYSAFVTVEVPFDFDELVDTIELNVAVESENEGTGDEETVTLRIQRESYALEILDVDVNDRVRAGEILPVDVIVKNRGMEFAEDTFVRASIPALGIEDRAFFGDLSFVDQPFTTDPFDVIDENNVVDDDRLEKEDAAERRLFLRIPSDAKAGAYVVEISAFNADAITTVTKRIVVTGAEATTRVVVPVHSKTFNAGETAEYDLVLVNSGESVEIFELVIESPADLKVSVSEPVVVLAPGTSRTVKIGVTSDKEDTYNFAVNIHSGAELVKRESFTATVEGTQGVVAGSPAIILTVVLAVIFVVLLIVLIVLLTRKPEIRKETGESYY